MSMMMLLLILVVVAYAPHPALVSAASNTTSTPPIALPGCQDHCGNISIPYPFGIGPNCFHNSSFEIICNLTLKPLRQASLATLSWHERDDNTLNILAPVNILGIDLGTSPPHGPPTSSTVMVTGSYIGFSSRNPNASLIPLNELNMTGSPYVLMAMRNSLVVTGCGGSVVIRNAQTREIVAGCSSLCNNNSTTSPAGYKSCYGIGCCQTSIPISLDHFYTEYLTTVLKGQEFSDSIEAAVLDNTYPQNDVLNGYSLQDHLPSVLQWTVPDLPIDSPKYSNSRCEWDANLRGYTCSRCREEYYIGNPYLPNGCQVIKECEECPNICASEVVGNTTAYRCVFPIQPKKSSMPISLGLGISLGSVLLFVILYGLSQLVRKRKEIRQKQDNFKRNGGLLLQQNMPTSESSIEKTKIFTSSDLERATDNFNENRILGRGGQGTVYKGMLVDGTIVAIKKSKKVDESQLGQFINEVVILSQVNHRNVVSLFGCCLETEVPLLVYEFVPNGTLFQHIHYPTEDFRLTWKIRLQTAIDSAEALAYLHSSSQAPIYHRDIKTSNILLDDKYRAKVSDFGTSKTISIDQTHVTTCIQGTFGYIDPEFFQSNQFTEKSDVYSFGVVLVELITSKKPIYADSPTESKSLASEFLFLMQNSRLYDIVDGNVLEEATKEEIDGIADLAKSCLHLNGKQRPTMKEVAVTLQMIISKNYANGINPSSKSLLKGKESFMVNEISMVIDRDLLSYSSTYASSSTEGPDQQHFSSTDYGANLHA